MNSSTVVALLGVLALGACGGGGKGADSPGTCPEGTVLKGEDCVPPESASGDSPGGAPHHVDSDDEDKPKGNQEYSPEPASAGAKTPYDKDAVEAELKRAARQVKSNCGSATDNDGKATGPWGTTKASLTLGRNGRIRQVSVPAPYDGKPVGICVVHAFEHIQFPPYAASSDVVIDWDVELKQPKR